MKRRVPSKVAEGRPGRVEAAPRRGPWRALTPSLCRAADGLAGSRCARSRPRRQLVRRPRVPTAGPLNAASFCLVALYHFLKPSRARNQPQQTHGTATQT
ncbi:hypothetical protein AAFF_G00285460 [Aldrovandia affinis]|uniref:Uncharacterized protein n=1 Tax=Aldrovandia affinis TaxID=143900 RepID=A0AAD7TAD5_9TELE|nr:hypothetical protein AAFF_G00285460 [Aldrovandia affinis]